MTRGQIARNVTRGAFYLSIEKASALISGVAYFALLLRWLGPTKYGIMTLALSFAGLATAATGNFEMYLERYAAEYLARGQLLTLRRAHRIALFLKLGLGALASLVVIAIAPFLARQFNTPELALLLPILTATIASDGLSTTGRATLYGIQQFKWVSGLAVAFHLAKTIMVGMLWASRMGLFELAIGLVLLMTLQGVVAAAVPLWMLRRARDVEPDGRAADPGAPRPLVGSIFSYCIPLLGARVTFMSGQNLGKIILGKLFTTTELGYFSFAFQTVERFVEVVHTLPASLLPSLTQLVALGERERLRRVFDDSLRIIQVVACALSFGLFVFAREITLLVGSPLFEPAVPLLRVLALVPMARTAQQPLTMIFQALRMPGAVLRLALLKFVAEFGCYFALVPTLGMAGATWANLTGALASYLAALALLARRLPDVTGERARGSWRVVALFAPLLVAGFLIDGRLPTLWSIAARGVLTLGALWGVFALSLVNRCDLERMSAIPLTAGWMRLTRDAVVSAAGRLARAAEPRRAS
jgi:O-antigen/teichoic acid export membrane protein